jgi:hypothetical protein
MQQDGIVRSTPSAVSGVSELISKGFGVTYEHGSRETANSHLKASSGVDYQLFPG